MLFLLLGTIITVLGISAICSLTEAATLSLNPMRLEAMKREGQGHAAIWLELKKNVERPISAILIINTVANTGGATLIGYLYDQTFGHAWLGVFLAGFTLTLLYVSEIMPKFVGAVFAEKLAPFLAVPLQTATVLLAPMINLTHAVAERFRRNTVNSGPTSTDIEVLAQVARSHNVIAQEQEKIIVNAAKLRQLKVADIMIPREWIVFLNLSLPTAENLRRARQALHTRYPVSPSEDIEGINGYINFKDLLAFQDEEEELRLDAFVRPILSLTPEMTVNAALRQLTARRYHIAMVYDKQDKVMGLITLEDILEELVGDIEDEFDATGRAVIQISPTTWRLGAALTMDKVAGLLEIKGLHADELKLTLGDWLNARTGHNFHSGSVLTHAHCTFTVQQSRRGRIFQVLVVTGMPVG